MVSRLLLLLSLALPAAAEEKLLEHPYWSLPASSAPAAAGALVSGELLEYEIYWGLVHVGKSYLKIERTVDISSRPAWHIVSEAKSGPFIKNFYKVADRNDAWMDAQDLTSYGYYKKIQEGGHFFNEWVIFDARELRSRIQVSAVIGPPAPQIVPKKHVALARGMWQSGARHRPRPK